MATTRFGLASAERRYAVHDVIGAGGMATVHLGRLLGPMGFSRAVAIKRLHQQYARDPEFTEMFLDEGRIASRIHHPNVVSTIDVVCMDGELLLVMEYVHGEALSKILKAATLRDQRLPMDVAAAIASGILHGLHAAHCATGEDGEPLDLVHRDVSPQNVIVGLDGVTRVMDFGVAKAAGQLHTTRDGQLKGKMAYMAPEQLRSGLSSPASDIWGASVVLWEMLSGDRLFSGGSDAEVFGRVLYDTVRPVLRDGEPIPKELDAVVARGLCRFPERRFETARDMALALEQAVTPATPSQVAAWVSSLELPALQEREDLLARVESQPPTRILGPEVSGSAGPAPRSPILFFAFGAVALAAALSVGAFVLLRSRANDTVAVAVAPPSSATARSPEPSSVAPASSAPASDLAAPMAAPPAARTAEAQSPRRPSVTGPRSRPSALDKNRCYTVDRSGIWHVKPECL
jgi:eukaryotic-like serine/threonine-protein kinase